VDVVYGIDRGSFRAVSGGFVFLEGHDMEGPDDLLWTTGRPSQAHQSGRHLQSAEPRLARRRHYRTWKGARLFVPLATLQDLVGARDKASIF